MHMATCGFMPNVSGIRMDIVIASFSPGSAPTITPSSTPRNSVTSGIGWRTWEKPYRMLDIQRTSLFT